MKGKLRLKTTLSPPTPRSGPSRIPMGLVIAAAIFLHRDATAVQFTVDSVLASDLALPVGYRLNSTSDINWSTITGRGGPAATTAITDLGNVLLVAGQISRKIGSGWTTLPLGSPLAAPGRGNRRRSLPAWEYDSRRTGDWSGPAGNAPTSVPDGGSTLLLLGSVLIVGSGLRLWSGFRRARFAAA